MTEFTHIPKNGMTLEQLKKETVKEIKQCYLTATNNEITEPILVGAIFFTWLRDALEIVGDNHSGYNYFIPNYEKNGKKIQIKTNFDMLARTISICGTSYDFN